MNSDGLVQAITMTPKVQQWLGKPTAVSLLHIFDLAVNLIDSEGDIISLVQPQIGAGPFALVVDGQRPFPHHISPHDPIRKTADSLQIGKLQINLRTVNIWYPRPRWELLQKQRPFWQLLLPRLQTAVTQERHRLITGSPTHFAEHFQRATAAVQQAVAQSNEEKLQTAAATLAGLGPGFTPAGDDFLLGLLLGLWATRPEAEVVQLAEIVRETAVPRTTQLSAAWLTAAAQGEAILAWHHLTNALLAGHGWESPTNDILDTGATSGIAALLGFLAACPSPI